MYLITSTKLLLRRLHTSQLDSEVSKEEFGSGKRALYFILQLPNLFGVEL